MKDKHYAAVDELIAEIAGMSIEELANEPWEGPHLISVDELRAAGALDVPAAWRKSLGEERTRNQSELFADDFQDAAEQDRVELDTGDEASADGDA